MKSSHFGKVSLDVKERLLFCYFAVTCHLMLTVEENNKSVKNQNYGTF